MTLVANIKTPTSHTVMTLKIDGDWETRSPVVITHEDDDGGMDEDNLRYWLNHVATGMFGHLVGSDKQAAPADVYHALLNTQEWNIMILQADVREVRLDLPPGAVS